MALCGIHILCIAATISPNLTADYNSRKKQVELKWQNIDANVKGFVLQRSSDNQSWKEIYKLDPENFSKKKQERFYDQNPEATTNYYRLKIINADRIEYSTVIMVIIGSPASSWIMFPVPVREVLNLQYNGSDAIQGVVSVFIQNMAGYVFVRKRFSSLNRLIQIPVDNLGRGTYDIRIMIKDEVVWNQRFVK